MKREDIDKAASALYGIAYFKKDITDFAIEQVNAALEEGAVALDGDAAGNTFAAMRIRALKII